MDRGQQVIADRSFGERQKERFVHRSGRTLRGWVEPANRVDFVAEEFDAHRALGLGRVDVEDAATQGVLAGHLDDVGGAVADGVQVREQSVGIERFAAANGARKVSVKLGCAEADGRSRDWRHYDRCSAGGNLPQGGSALFLEFRMRREILKRQHVAGGQRDYGFGIAGGGEVAESTEDGDEFLDGAIVVYDER